MQSHLQSLEVRGHHENLGRQTDRLGNGESQAETHICSYLCTHSTSTGAAVPGGPIQAQVPQFLVCLNPQRSPVQPNEDEVVKSACMGAPPEA